MMMPKVGDFNIGKEISRGSNSIVYEAYMAGKENNGFVAKCSINNSNYISFNLQRHSYQVCHEIFDEDILVPKVFAYYTEENIGDVLILERMHNLFDVDFIINREYYYSEIVINKIAKAIAILHNNSISGYDIELYWNPDLNKLVILDVGPDYTIGVDTIYSIKKHWELEKDNYMGLWNIQSQILDAVKAKAIFKDKSVKEQAVDILFSSIDPSSVTLHVEDVAKVHALSIFGRISPVNRGRLFDLFVKEYKKNRDSLDIDSQRYIKSLKEGVIGNLSKAKAKLYYSLENTLSEESCCAEITR